MWGSGLGRFAWVIFAGLAGLCESGAKRLFAPSS
jgi:hypothetical protein